MSILLLKVVFARRFWWKIRYALMTGRHTRDQPPARYGGVGARIDGVGSELDQVERQRDKYRVRKLLGDRILLHTPFRSTKSIANSAFQTYFRI